MDLQNKIQATIYDFNLNGIPPQRTAKRIMQLIKEDRSPQAGPEAVSAELALLSVEDLAEELHNCNLDAWRGYETMGKCAEQWNRFRKQIAIDLLERLTICRK